MKIAIVSLAHIADRSAHSSGNQLPLSAGYHLDRVDGKEAQAAVEDAQRRVNVALRRLNNTIAAATEASARTQRNIQEGKVIPYVQDS